MFRQVPTLISKNVDFLFRSCNVVAFLLEKWLRSDFLQTTVEFLKVFDKSSDMFSHVPKYLDISLLPKNVDFLFHSCNVVAFLLEKWLRSDFLQTPVEFFKVFDRISVAKSDEFSK